MVLFTRSYKDARSPKHKIMHCAKYAMSLPLHINLQPERHLTGPVLRHTVHITTTAGATSYRKIRRLIHTNLGDTEPYSQKPRTKLYGVTSQNVVTWILTNDKKCAGRDIVVGVATRYRLDSPRIESRCTRHFLHRPDWQCGPPNLLPEGKAPGAWRWLPIPN